MFHVLYTVIIYPLYQIIELIYELCFQVFKNQGPAIVGVSLGVSFLCLPLYVIAENWQEKERQTEASLKKGVDRIKAVFKGDEQYMILSAYYRQNHYHPAMALRSSLSLLIQIPFFIAAYTFLSNLEALKGYSFFFIRDMGAPDALFHIGSFPVNVLPIAMTIINITSGVIYSKGHPLKEKLQIYIMALFFLVFLYDSPAGLVFYWTLNNVFSLLKNIFYKFKKPLRALYFCLVAGVLGLDWFLLFKHNGFLYRRLFLVGVLCIIPVFPLILKGINWLLDKPFKKLVSDRKTCLTLFFISAVTLAILAGYTIPSFLVSSSPDEFSFVDDIASPFYFLRNCSWQALGLFVFWPACLYFMFNDKVKATFAILFSSFALCGIVNAFVFSGDYGNISTILTFSNAGTIPPTSGFALLNVLALIAVLAVIVILIIFNRTSFISSITGILAFSLCAVCVSNSIKIKNGYEALIELKSSGNGQQITEVTPVFHLSKTEPNVIIIMQDRLISTFIPYIFEEKPELYDSFDGFTWYPNCVSFGNCTLFGSPPLYGGYEYTPYEMNERASEPLMDKHNESLKVLPVLFSQNGYDTTVTDMSWANYSWFADLRIFDDYPEIHQQPTIRVYADAWQKKHPEVEVLSAQSSCILRNFLWFSFFKIMPSMLRETVYDDGNWWTSLTSSDFIKEFIDSYAALDLLEELTDMDNTEKSFTYIVNEATHDPQITGYPDYNLTTEDFGPGILGEDAYYHANFSTFLKWAEFFDYLKEQGVYDNTRIILVSDHANPTTLSELDPEKEMYENYNPVLLVKDFNQRGLLKTDDTFMTNADTPVIATDGLIENAANPFTGKAFTDTVSKDKVYITKDHSWAPDRHGKYVFTLKDWWSVKDTIFDLSNWANESPYEVDVSQ